MTRSPIWGASNWTDYTAEADIAFRDPGTEGSAAHAYILGRDSIIVSDADPCGGAYIAGVDIENCGGGTGEIFIFKPYDANGDPVISPGELVCLGRKSLLSQKLNFQESALRVQINYSSG